MFDGVDRIPSNVRVGALVNNRQTNFDDIGDTGDTGDALGVSFGGAALAKAPDETGKRDNAILDRDRYIGGIDGGI